MKPPTPPPLIYFSPHHVTHLGIIPHPKSWHIIGYQQVIDVAGPYSGVALVLKEILPGSTDIKATTLSLKNRGLGWFAVMEVSANDKSSMKSCKLRMLS